MGGWLEALSRGLGKTRAGLWERVGGLLRRRGLTVEEEGALEEALIAADVGVDLARLLIEAVRGERAATVSEALRKAVIAIFPPVTPLRIRTPGDGPAVWLFAGVNGVGKTTTIGKLAARYQKEGMSVVLAAADTFRAAAIPQLEIWARRSGAAFIHQMKGSDPAAVAHDAVTAARARGADLVLIDTAGRLHTRSNLMEELRKIHRVVGKPMPGAPHEVFLVVDSNTGQNALNQAATFHAAIPVTGIVLTKLDGTARGGVVLTIARNLGIPVRWVGVGEGEEDLIDFSPEAFAEVLLSG